MGTNIKRVLIHTAEKDIEAQVASYMKTKRKHNNSYVSTEAVGLLEKIQSRL